MLNALATVPKPPGIAALPTDHRGYPITFITDVEDGRPDFRITNQQRWLQAVRTRLCGMCGGPMRITEPIAFIGSQPNLDSQLFYDPAMHGDCAEYAMAVCPFLALPTARRSGRALPEGDITFVPSERQRPDRMFIMRTYGYDMVQMTAEAPFPWLIHPWTCTDLRWF